MLSRIRFRADAKPAPYSESPRLPGSSAGTPTPLSGPAVVLAFLLCFIPMGLPVDHQALAAEEGSASSSDGTGIKVASWALTVPYCLGKALYAGVGAIIGGFTYVLSGGNTEAAKDVWVKSIYGTYIIRPEHLRGEEPIHFVGKAKDE